MFDVAEARIPGCFEIFPRVAADQRGMFVKTFHEPAFKEHGLITDFAEEYYSVSRHRVLRGLHFQLPPFAHTKLVYCLSGNVVDVVVDLRTDSRTFGRHQVFELDSNRPSIVYIPPGLAHGFCVTSESAVVQYKVTAVYSSEHDSGILWTSVGVQWPVDSPILSKRDESFPTLSEFHSPFRMETTL